MLLRMLLVPQSLWSFSFRSISCNPSRLSYKDLIKQYPSVFIQWRWKSSGETSESSVSKLGEHENVQLTVAEKVKQTTKDAAYISIIIAGVGVTGIMFYAIFSELFAKLSPNSVYSAAFKICCSDTNIVDALGEPIKGYGELSSRGRRRHVSHVKYEKDGRNFMRMKFYLKGSRRSGIVHLEIVEGGKSKYEYRYLFVDLDGFPQRTIILKDNRHLDIGSINYI